MVDDNDPSDDKRADSDRAPGGSPAPMDFNLFVLSLNASALMHLGQSDGGADGAQVNLPMARQTIDMIALMEEKTRGNLTGEEDRLIHQVLFDLRMRFSEAAGTKTTSEKESP